MNSVILSQTLGQSVLTDLSTDQAKASGKLELYLNEYLREHSRVLAVKFFIKHIPAKLPKQKSFLDRFLYNLQTSIDHDLKRERSACGCPVQTFAKLVWEPNGNERYFLALMFDFDAFQRASRDDVTKQIKNWLYRALASALRAPINSVYALVEFSSNGDFVGIAAGHPKSAEKIEVLKESLFLLTIPACTPSGNSEVTFRYRKGFCSWHGVNPPQRYFRRNGSIVDIPSR
ncbi:inovirus-type Gp2 protein [Vibrio sp. SCSIO 43169]|uniref:YagK/YfjJ domain-containing protein n=1 Tax=Vibrio sp. SCSIO 43169 TaxID=2822801 RepID=UPI00204350E5|nr:inovirus-type Gp2 protein [Vibrio sp. SCSIO 43169]MCM5506715.1 inovirus-type Gp2 protein [Vibrio sp. SCSIO 43169]